ncbi:TonB-linked outer membrane protein, SusC/RagA family [Chitinophaga costaii]|uniref:TonB-linked outer membrane protein, SusC/RagA family n=1 Tax=Chitinophaga costaii TaxID=1335309 RepID=A0A1C4AUV4_9BACT|nr:SusC/RagA family TonB-linked outer membrane protein [Chitinophaga costaii]PUZ26752.1 SusC/RagA family TonB-linked outer membrane protein [Chitinophaga costaii]SCB98341.1 TonB-linked outer membrane protein, SusC/RagA family [Chitinophaga costaii]
MQHNQFRSRRCRYLLLFALLHLCVTGVAQDVTYTGKDVPIKTVFKEVEKQTGYFVMYNGPVLNNIPPVSIKADHLALQKFLDLLFADLPVDYVIRSKTIMLFPKQQPPSGGTQPAPVSGIITDKNGQPLNGATVRVKGKNLWVTTGANGQFSIPAEQGDILLINCLNQAPTAVKVDAVSGIKIMLQPLIMNLGETVVNGIYKRPVENYTGEARTYTVDQLRRVNNTNVISALRSLDASFQVPSDLNFGSDPNHLPQIQVRGANSIANTNLTSQYGYISNPPLFVLDGFEVPLQKIYDLDMNRVSKVTILKDAAATAIYGSKAANGVLVIETVQPRTGRLRLSYNNNLSVNAPDLTSYHLLNASQKLQLEQVAGIYNITSSLPLSAKEKLDEVYNNRLAEIKRGVNTYWLSQPLKTAFGQKHSIYLDGGDEYMRYGVDLSYAGTPGVMKGSKRDNLSGGVNLMYHKGALQFTNYLSVTSNKAENSPYGDFSQYAKMNPYFRPVDSVSGKTAKILQESNDQIGMYDMVYNPMYDASLKTKNNSDYVNITENFQADWNILPALKLSTRFSMYNQSNTADVFLPADAVEFVNTPDSLFSTRGYYQQTNGLSSSYQGDVYLNYGANFGKHTLFSTAGYHIQEDKANQNTVMAQGFPNADLDNILFGLQYPVNGKPTGTESIQRLISYYANVSYAYDYRYLLDLSFREDGSSLFGADKHYAPFWSVGLGWNVNKEHFLHIPDMFNRLKLRASYGSTGSQDFPSFAAAQTYQYLTSTRYLDHIGASLLSLGNTSLKWQQTNKFNLGTDIEMFKGRLQVTFNYYTERTNDLFTTVNTTPSSGFSSFFANLGTVQNRGLELYLTLFAVKKVKENIYWSFYGNLLHNQNKLLRISDALKAQNEQAVDQQTKSDDPVTAPVLQYKEGQSVSTIYAVRSLGIDPSTGNEVFLTADGKQTYKWSPRDEVPVGDNQPKVTGNFGSNLMYKGFSINVSMRTELGGQMYNSTLSDRVENANPVYNVDIRVLTDRWQKPGDNARYKGLTNLNGNTRTDITKATSRFIQDNNTLYCDAITLGYLFPHLLTDQWKMSRLQCFFYINNPFLVSSIRQERGLSYPFARNYSFSLQLGF